MTATKALPNTKKAPTPFTHPYMLEQKYADPRYFKTLSSARSAVYKQLEAWHKNYFRLQDKVGMQAVNVLVHQVNVIGYNGGMVEGVLDPFTGTRFDARITRRTQA